MIEYIVSFINTLGDQYVAIFLSLFLGLFIGIERERSGKMAGIRTFALVCILGAVLSVFNFSNLIILGMFVVIVIGSLMGIKGITSKEEIGLSLTTSMSLIVTYVTGIVVGKGELIVASIIAIVTASLLISKDKLHTFAGHITEEEFYSALELLTLSIIVYPLLPSENIGPSGTIDLQLVWALIIAVSGLGFLNYILVKKYEEKGFIATGFFGGLVNSTAVIGTIADKVSDKTVSVDLAVATVLLANSAMALRNAIIVGIFEPRFFTKVSIPLISVTIAGLITSYYVTDLKSEINKTELDSPFSIKNVMIFGTIFMIILVISSFVTNILGNTGFYLTMFLAGLVSSGSSTTTAVTLASTGQISLNVASFGVLLGTASSIFAKIILIRSIDDKMLKKTIIWSFVLLSIGSIFALISVNIV